MEEKNQINSVAKALKMLEIIGNSGREVALTEVAKVLNMHKSTAFRLLSTLEINGFIFKNIDTGKYKLGLKILQLAGELLDNIELRKIARPIIEDLVEKCNETAHLVELEKNSIVYIDKVESTNTIRLHSRIGFHGFPHCTSAGKVLLAHMSEKKLKKLISEMELPKKTINTITDPEVLINHLAVVKQQGYAIDNIENEEGVRCVAAPVRNHLSQVIAAISVAGPSSRMKLDVIENNLKFDVMRAAEDVSRLLGYKV